ncbi:MAG: glutamine amidotransferase [Pseudomonadota bacterium]
MTLSLAFDPLFDWVLIALLGALAFVSVATALWRGLPGWWLRGLAFGLLILALAGPQLKREEREGIPSIGFLVVDRSESTELEGREEAIAAAAEALTDAAAALSTPEAPLELRVIEAEPDPSGRNRGTQLLSALDEAAARVAPEQVAGALLLTDGQVHDADRMESFAGPVHALIAGGRDRFDLKLSMETAPVFGIVGESVTFAVTAEALGAVPQNVGADMMAELSIDGGPPQAIPLPRGIETEIEVEITHGGPTVVDLRLPALEDELTDRNNRLITTVNGVRDRLRVLLVSGEPHPGGRIWRDLLKSDPIVDLIHFTILRPPAKQDGTPVSELSLIAFPTRELFLEKIDGFDLIVFDRYRWRGVLASAYLSNVARYVRDGGAVLVASGPAFAGAQSLSRTPLSDVLPAEPTLDVFERAFTPRVSDVGRRHPVTADLALQGSGVGPDWGRWLRQLEVIPRSGHTVMEGIEGKPLMILDRVGEGRVALLTSDHAWLWNRGFEGGGPQVDLLRRTAHWLMQEPELEEDALFAHVQGEQVQVERRSLEEAPSETVAATAPSGEERELSLRPAGPGRWTAMIEEAEQGLWRFFDGQNQAVAAVGPPAPAEYENPLASTEPLSPLVDGSGGEAVWLEEGMPDLRLVSEGRRAHGRDWLGLVSRDAYRVTGVSLSELLPPWLAALASGLMFLVAWRIEGR